MHQHFAGLRVLRRSELHRNRLASVQLRSEDGVSWEPVVELDGLRFDTLNVEGDTIFAAATPASGAVKIYSLDIEDCFPIGG